MTQCRIYLLLALTMNENGTVVEKVEPTDSRTIRPNRLTRDEPIRSLRCVLSDRMDTVVQ